MKHRIPQDDKLRAILTDLIPYEVPLRFSFLHIYSIFNKQNHRHWMSRLIDQFNKCKSSVPYSYFIRRGQVKHRKLSLIHPLLLKDAALIYHEYNDVILSLCSKSSWSLRAPAYSAKVYYSKEDRETQANQSNLPQDDDDQAQDIGLTAEEESVHQDHASSYFVYKPHNLLQRFFNSTEIITLERKYLNCRRLDIAKCFENIYSHSISWAVKGKSKAKKEIQCKYTFDSRFDSFMQKTNHRETHGILIGSELSRIFAEIILQEVDVRACENIHNIANNGIKSSTRVLDGFEFTVRRYIDDYFIFFNENWVANLVQDSIERQLSEYKLFLNSSKTTELQRPFIIPISSARSDLRELIRTTLDFEEIETSDESDELRSIRSRSWNSTKILLAIRSHVAKHNISIPDVSASLLKHLSVLVRIKLKYFKNCKSMESYSSPWLECVLNIIFYLFSVDIRFRTSVLVGKILCDFVNNQDHLSRLTRRNSEEIIIRESISIIKQVVDSNDIYRLEIVNYLICLRGLDGFWRVPSILLESLYLPDGKKPAEIDYFSTIGLIYFFCDRDEFKGIKNKLLENTIEYLYNATDYISDTKALSLSLDLLACPWVDRSFKMKLATKLANELGSPNPTQEQLGNVVNEFSAQIWLFDWRDSISNELYLSKKELSLSY
ncbi:MAG: antiviral reverse transcriptase Drt3b [Verrucomicrobiota bacterium]